MIASSTYRLQLGTNRQRIPARENHAEAVRWYQWSAPSAVVALHCDVAGRVNPQPAIKRINTAAHQVARVTLLMP